MHGAADHGRGELICRCGDSPCCRDQGTDTVIGATDQVTSELDRAVAGHLKVLPGACALAKPGVVTDGDEERRVLGIALHEVRINNLVTDEGRNRQVAGEEGALLGLTGNELRHGQVEECDGAPEPALQWHILPKGHQLLFMVRPRSGAEGRNAVVAPRVIAGGNAGDERAVQLRESLVDWLDNIQQAVPIARQR